MEQKGKKITGALGKDVREKPMERLSPGVYRGAKGGLVSQRGRVMNRPSQQNYQTTPPVGAPTNPYTMQTAYNMADQIAAQQALENAPAGMENLPYKMIPAEYRDAMRTAQQPQQPVNPLYIAPGYENQTGRGMQPWYNAPNLPQPSANQGGKYRLSPGIYGTREQAMNQYNSQIQQQMENTFQNYQGIPLQQQAVPMRRR